MQTKPASAMRVQSPDLAAAQLPQTVPECHAVIAQLLERVKLITQPPTQQLQSTRLALVHRRVWRKAEKDVPSDN